MGAWGVADAVLGMLQIDGNRVRYWASDWPIKQCSIEFFPGAQKSRMTATRIGVGAIAAGPVGAIIGAMSKKDVSKAWIFLSTPSGVKQISVKPRDFNRAMMFVRKFHEIQAKQ